MRAISSSRKPPKRAIASQSSGGAFLARRPRNLFAPSVRWLPPWRRWCRRVVPGPQEGLPNSQVLSSRSCGPGTTLRHHRRHGGSHLTDGAKRFLVRRAKNAPPELCEAIARFGGFLELEIARMVEHLLFQALDLPGELLF